MHKSGSKNEVKLLDVFFLIIKQKKGEKIMKKIYNFVEIQKIEKDK